MHEIFSFIEINKKLCSLYEAINSPNNQILAIKLYFNFQVVPLLSLKIMDFMKFKILLIISVGWFLNIRTYKDKKFAHYYKPLKMRIEDYFSTVKTKVIYLYNSHLRLIISFRKRILFNIFTTMYKKKLHHSSYWG